MINSVIDGIVRAINSEFEGYSIYTEEVLQGLRQPCFFVYCANPTFKKYIGSRCLKKSACVVQYFGKTSEKKSEYNAVIERLVNCLEYITVNDRLVRGSDIKFEVVDSVLNMKITYSMWEYGQGQAEKMLSLKTM